ncbi:DUF440 family protein [Flocculibacter collagenilyticus]|uniref:DUF440 family protein n=1 Tax=Flocculibacter collagenilyticus TaxID=2744479 RepID=UPI0018F5A6DA|nr:DUF440 family protein [Flocculibacter collagenilyticus]
MLSIEQVSELAEDIFYELAEDNLSAEKLDEFDQQAEQIGFVEARDPQEAIWLASLDFVPDPEDYAEVIIGLNRSIAADVNQQEVFARILISKDEDDKFCHILWPEKPAEH